MDSISTLFYQLKQADLPTYIEKTIAYYGALVYTGKRPAIYVTFPINREDVFTHWTTYSQGTLKKYRLEAYIIDIGEDRMSALLFDRKALANTLQENQKWLQAFAGYPVQCQVDAYLDHLKYRFRSVSCPDELGVFLGYPMKDIHSYITNQGKDFLYCGYWKVYHDVEDCLQKFKQYDRIRFAVAKALVDPVVSVAI